MAEKAGNSDFMKKYVFAVAMTLKKGLHIHSEIYKFTFWMENGFLFPKIKHLPYTLLFSIRNYETHWKICLSPFGIATYKKGGIPPFLYVL